jgi:hypothetical protein
VIELAGTVSSAEGEPLEGYPVHLWGPGGDVILLSGSDPSRGASGWSHVAPSQGETISSTWHLQLHLPDVYQNYPPVSPIVQVALSGTCRDGLALIHFRERQD